jgi:hypothetical protein
MLIQQQATPDEKERKKKDPGIGFHFNPPVVRSVFVGSVGKREFYLRQDVSISIRNSKSRNSAREGSIRAKSLRMKQALLNREKFCYLKSGLVST